MEKAMCLEVSSSRFETYPGCFSFSRNTPCHGWPEHHERDAPSKSILNHPCYESNCLCARIKAREGGIVLEEHLKSTAKNVRMGREYAPHAGESSGISAAHYLVLEEKISFVPSFLRENHLSTVKGDLFCIDKVPARHGREHLSIVIDVPWKANAARYHASRFNEPVSFVSSLVSFRVDP